MRNNFAYNIFNNIFLLLKRHSYTVCSEPRLLVLGLLYIPSGNTKILSLPQHSTSLIFFTCVRVEITKK